jgi:hypothetical protein
LAIGEISIFRRKPLLKGGIRTAGARNHISKFYLMEEPVVKCGDVFLRMAPAVRRERKERDIRRGLEAQLIY